MLGQRCLSCSTLKMIFHTGDPPHGRDLSALPSRTRPGSVCPDTGSGTRPATATCYQQVCSWSEAHRGTHRGARTLPLPHGGLEHGAGLTCWGPGVWRRPPRPGSPACDRRGAAPPGRRWSPRPPARGTRPR